MVSPLITYAQAKDLGLSPEVVYDSASLFLLTLPPRKEFGAVTELIVGDLLVITVSNNSKCVVEFGGYIGRRDDWEKGVCPDLDPIAAIAEFDLGVDLTDGGMGYETNLRGINERYDVGKKILSIGKYNDDIQLGVFKNLVLGLDKESRLNSVYILGV